MGGFQGSGRPNLTTLADKIYNTVSAPGEIFTESTSGLNSIRLQVAGADPSNVILIEGSIDGVTWNTVGSIAGNSAALLDIQAYDLTRISTSTYGGTPYSVSWRTETYPAAYGLIDRKGNAATIEDGALRVKAEIVDGGSGAGDAIEQNIFREVTSVPSGSLTTIATYTVPAGTEFRILNCSFGGDNIARYELLIDGNVEARQRTWFNGDITGSFNFLLGQKDGLGVDAGSTIVVQVEHNRPFLGSFEARIFGVLIIP